MVNEITIKIMMITIKNAAMSITRKSNSDSSEYPTHRNAYRREKWCVLICIKMQRLRLKKNARGRMLFAGRQSIVQDDARSRREKYYGTESVHAPRRISVIIIPHSRRTFHSHGCGTLAPQIAIEDARGCNGDGNDGGGGGDDSHNQRSLSRSRNDILSSFLLRFFLSDLSQRGAARFAAPL